MRLNNCSKHVYNIFKINKGYSEQDSPLLFTMLTYYEPVFVSFFAAVCVLFGKLIPSHAELVSAPHMFGNEFLLPQASSLW